jgi:hypothetical protein
LEEQAKKEKKEDLECSQVKGGKESLKRGKEARPITQK